VAKQEDEVEETERIHEQLGGSGGGQDSSADGRESQDRSSTLQHDAGVSWHRRTCYLRNNLASFHLCSTDDVRNFDLRKLCTMHLRQL